MQCYTELIPPTAVTHAVSLPFLGPEANNLVVAKTSLLQVFGVKDGQPGNGDTELNGSNGTSKLVLIGEYSLSGTVTSLAAVKALHTRTGGEALLIAFKDAKLSFVEWDPENYRISTISIHYYEGENVLNQPFGPSLAECESILTVDPSSRCAALKFGTRHLAILPFRQTGDDLADEVDDAFDAEMGVETSSATLKRTQSGPNMEVDDEAKQTSYKASFVLPMTALDPALTHPVHLAFLHEYREPTFGILSAATQPSTALLAVDDRKDCLTYTVFTLDLEQRASTNLISVPKLPSDLWKVIPLARPVGGALLVGTNEFVHVDQSGKTTAVAVNEFAMRSSNLNMTDQTHLNMKLEDCEIEALDVKNGELLVVLNDASLAVLSFKMLGRNVGGLDVLRVSAENGGALLQSAPSSLASLQSNKVFVASEDGNSAFIGWSTGTLSSLSKKRSHAQMLGQDAVADEAAEDAVEDIDEDDLYAPSADAAKRAVSSSDRTGADNAASYNFTMQDELPSLGPINNFCLGKALQTGQDKLEMVAGIGRGTASRLAFMSRDIVPEPVHSTQFADAKGVWSVNSRAKATPEGEGDAFDNVLFVYDGEVTKVYDINHVSIVDDPKGDDVEPEDAGYTERTGTEFETEGETLSVFTLAHGTRIVQCRPTEIRTYEAELGLSQIIPQADEETDAELRIVATSFHDPYLLIIRDDSSLQVLQVVDGGDVEPLDVEGVAAQKRWLSGCLYAGPMTGGDACAFLLNEEGGLHVFSLPDLKPVYSAPTLPFLPPVLSADAPLRRGGKATLAELLVADLGTQAANQPYVVVRTAIDDLLLYEPFYYNTATTEAADVPGFANLRFRKVPNTYLPKYDENIDSANGSRPAALRSVEIGGRKAIYIPGASPSLMVKEATSLPKVLGLRTKDVMAFSPVNTPSCKGGFALVHGDGHVQTCQLPPEASFATGWSVQTLALGEPPQEVRQLGFHEERGVYAVVTNRDVDFYFPDEDARHNEQEDLAMRPQIPHCTVHLLTAKSHQLIHSFDMPYAEVVTSLKVMPLEVSEHTHEQKSLVVVGTATLRGEDVPAKGAVVVFEIIDVVPEPERPETGVKLHVFSREETRGAITAVESFLGGLIGTSQGQKIMIRGLKEDGSCLPVAFLDAQCQITQLKTLGRSGMWLVGDAWKGLWFGGFTEEPYRLSLLGKSPRTQMEVISADMLPFDGQLFIMVIDAQMDLHVLQYDPENPKSMSGLRLLHKSTFHLGGHFPTQMALLPSTLAPFAEQQPLANGHVNGDDDAEDSSAKPPSLFFNLVTFQTGAVGLITPVDEATYRRLSALQTHLTSILEHAAGLNPRAYRAVESEGFGARGVVDGSLVQRIGELGAARRAEVLGRAGADAWGLRSDLEILGGGGLGYL